MTATMMSEFFAQYQAETELCLHNVSVAQTAALADAIWAAYESRHNIYLAGSGGCATNSLHFASDLSSAAARPGQSAMFAKALVDNVARFTRTSNATGYDSVFAEQLRTEGLSSGDLLIALECSAASPTLVAACSYARSQGATAFALTGIQGRSLAAVADQLLEVATDNCGVVETVHLLLGHLLSGYLRHRLSHS